MFFSLSAPTMSEEETRPRGVAGPEMSDRPEVAERPGSLGEPGRPETPDTHVDEFPEPSPPLDSPGIPMSFISTPDPASPEPPPTELAFTDVAPSEAPELAEHQPGLPGGVVGRAVTGRGGDAPELVWSSLPEVVDWDHMTPPQVVNGDDVKIAMPSENEGPEVLPRPYAGPQPDVYDQETLVSKRSKWINRGRNKIILGVAGIIIVLVIAGIATGAAVGVIINKNNNNSQQQQQS